jgi:hypothetical protein
MADTGNVWPSWAGALSFFSTITTNNMAPQVMAFVMDNASNNDTMVTAIETRYQDHGIDFSAIHSRLRCMPHTCHLAALKVIIHYLTRRGILNLYFFSCLRGLA